MKLHLYVSSISIRLRTYFGKWWAIDSHLNTLASFSKSYIVYSLLHLSKFTSHLRIKNKCNSIYQQVKEKNYVIILIDTEKAFDKKM